VTDESPAKRRRGCLFYGCLGGTLGLLALLLALLLGLHELRKMIAKYTDTKPIALPTVEMSPRQLEEVQHRVESFKEAVRSGRATPPLELSSDDINAMIASDPNLREIKGKLYVTIQDSHLRGQLSFPLEQSEFRLLKGRYLNGTGTFSVSLQNGNLSVTPDVILVKGKPLPWIYMNRLRSQNLANAVNDNPQASVGLNRLQTIQIKNGKLILVPKPVE
jgi:hypothetical protein